MSAWLTLTFRLIKEARWALVLNAVALFGMSWLSVYRTGIIEARIQSGEQRSFRVQAFLRGFGGPSMDMSSIAIETVQLYLLFLAFPLPIVIIWGVSRGSGAVAGEIAQGTLDLDLSRPVRRTSYLLAHVVTTAFGLLAMIVAIYAGNRIGTAYNHVANPPPMFGVLRPAWNLAMVGWAIFGYTLFLSSFDIVRWRPTLFGTVITIGQLVAFAIANQPDWDEWAWLNRFNVFAAFYPVESAVAGATLVRHTAILGGVGAAGIFLAWLVFQHRDLPANG